MHKHMQEIQSKDWAKMQAYFKWNKDKYAPALKAMEDHNEFDFKDMFLEDPNLFVFFVRIHSENNNQYDVENFWSIHYQAYKKLKEDGFFNLDLTDKKLQLVKDFETKISGNCLVSKNALEDTMTLKKKKKEVSVHFDYHEVLDLIEEAYDVDVRGFFNHLKYETIKEIVGKYFPIENYHTISRTSPVNSLEANYLSIVSDHIDEQIEYIDFWHYMLNYDFAEISNGSISSMWKPEKEETIQLENIINTKDELKAYISNQIKKVFFKELSQLKEVDSYEIEFLIEW